MRELKREGGRELEAERRRRRPGESKVGDDSDGERKGEREGAEYSAAVSRLADSVRSCSECGMRGRRRQEAGANRREEETGKKLRTSVRMRKLCTLFSFFGVGGSVCAGMQEFVHLQEKFPRLEEGRGEIKKKEVERPTSEENSVPGCSDTVINLPTGMSSAVIL